MQTTFHRAFDMTANPFQSLEDVIETGFDRILTSGQQSGAREGTDLIAQLVQKAGEKITIMPGSGINEHNITEIARKTGAREFHGSFGKSIPSSMTFKNKRSTMGSRETDEYDINIADSEHIRRIKMILSRL
jgi:copper homeostasis protein